MALSRRPQEVVYCGDCAYVKWQCFVWIVEGFMIFYNYFIKSGFNRQGTFSALVNLIFSFPILVFRTLPVKSSFAFTCLIKSTPIIPSKSLRLFKMKKGVYVTGRRKRFRPHKVYIFLIRITSRVDLAMSVCLSG